MRGHDIRWVKTHGYDRTVATRRGPHPTRLRVSDPPWVKTHGYHRAVATRRGSHPTAARSSPVRRFSATGRYNLLRKKICPVPRCRLTPSCRKWSRRCARRGRWCCGRRPGRGRRPACRRPCSTPGWPAKGRSSSCSRGGWRPGRAPGAWPSSAAGGWATRSATRSASTAACGPRTRIQVVTEGILLRMLQDDPFLESVAVVVFDEFHERSLNSDLALAMVRRVRETVRPELKLVVMSATLDRGADRPLPGRLPGRGERGPAAPGRDRVRRGRGEPARIADRAAEGTRRILDRTDGDVLVFLPGRGRDPPDGPASGAAGRRAEPGRDAALRRSAGREAGRGARAERPPQGRAGDERGGDVDHHRGHHRRGRHGRGPVAGLRSARRHGPAATGADLPGVGRSAGRAARDGRGRASACGSGPSGRIAFARRTTSRRSAASTWPARCSNCGPGARRTCKAFPWFEPPPEAALEQAETLLRRLDALDAAGT